MFRVATEQIEIASTSYAGPAAGERALMRAVLEDAIHCLAGEVGPLRERPQLAADARAWIVEEDHRWAFSFDNICESLGLSAAAMRPRLLQRAPTLPLESGGAEVRVTARPRRPVPAEQDVMQMIREGHPLRVVAERFGISVSKASILSSGLASRIKAERDEEIRGLRREGWTHRALAGRFGLSRIRVMRICARRDACETDSRRTAA